MKPAKRSILAYALTATVFSFLMISCGGSDADVHDAPRETQEYEKVDPNALSRAEIKAHLTLLITRISSDTAAENTGEFHHLETALTATLKRLETIMTTESNAEALATIATLKPLAIKLHQAGHAGNAKMGLKLGKAIATSGTKLATQL